MYRRNILKRNELCPDRPNLIASRLADPNRNIISSIQVIKKPCLDPIYHNKPIFTKRKITGTIITMLYLFTPFDFYYFKPAIISAVTRSESADSNKIA